MEADVGQPVVQLRRTWTVDDLRALDVEDWRRFEIVDGPGGLARVTEPFDVEIDLTRLAAG